MKIFARWATVVLLVSGIVNVAYGGSADSVIKDLKALNAQGETASMADIEAVKSRIHESPGDILPLLIRKIHTPDLPEKELAMYVWAIGLTKSSKAVDDIIALAEREKSEIVLANARQALATIGGETSGQYLRRNLDQTTDPNIRYHLLDLLAGMHYEAALPAAAEILKKDPKRYYWQSIFVFGKYGDAAVPFLLEKIDDPDENTRANAIMVLGQWLIPPKAVGPLQRRYTLEQSPDVRLLILSGLEKINSDMDAVKAFSQKILKTEKNLKAVRFASETIERHEEIKRQIQSFKNEKQDAPALFRTEYRRLFDSLGRKGDYRILGAASTRADEAKLKKLKKVILQRNSDECFYDYQKINHIIILNRMIAAV